MDLTKEALNALDIPEAAISEILAAHETGVSTLEKKLADYEIEASNRQKTAALTSLLQANKFDERGYRSILRATDLNALVLDKNGKVKDADAFAETLKEEWSEFVVSERIEASVSPASPPVQSKESPRVNSLKDALKLKYDTTKE